MSTTSPVRRPSTARPIGEAGVTTHSRPSPPGPVSVIPAPTGARKTVRPSPVSSSSISTIATRVPEALLRWIAIVIALGVAGVYFARL